MSERIKEYSDEIPNELKMILEGAPKDDVDWVLVMYLFRYSRYPYGYGILFEEKNVITVGKISKWFNLEPDEVYKRLNRMKFWISVGTVYGYYKPFNVCNITQIGIDSIMKMIEIFEIKKR